MTIIKKFVIEGNSMIPALKPGGAVLASSLPYLFANPKKDDIVVCIDPRDRRILIKRIAKISKNEIFVVGDNPRDSTDSRHFGAIPRNAIVGKVVSTL